MTVLEAWGRPSSANAINDGGTIVGHAYRDDYGPVAVRWDNTGTMTVLEGGRFAYGINDHGAAVGNRWLYERDLLQPVRWTATGQVSDLALPEPSRGADAYAINNDGIAVGEAWVGTSPQDAVRHAVRWDQDGQFTFLAPLEGSVACSAVAVNSSGEAVGSCSMPGRYFGAARWDAAGNVVDLGLLCGIESAAYDINDSGIVVGTAKDHNLTTHAVRWDTNSGCRGLPTLPGGTWAEAKSIGNDGTVAGFSQRGTEYTYRAVRWDD